MPKAKQKTRKRAERPAVEKYRGVSLTGGFWIWLAVWFVGLLSTQLLRSSASNIFFSFICFLPIISLIYALIGRSAIRVYMTSDTAVAEKLAPAEYEFRIYNESILPYPFVDAWVRLPDAHCVKCNERRMRISVPPTSDYTIRNSVAFRFRGTYEIGVSCFYVYDFFRMFRVKVLAECVETVYVLPRKLVMNEDKAQSVSDSARQTKKNQNSYEKIEVSDIRDYRLGDPIKSIHWKLSSKSENLVIKEYNSGTSDITYVFADMSRRFPDEAPDRPFVFVAPESKAEDAAAPANEGKAKKLSAFQKKLAAAANTEIDLDELVNDAAYEDMNEYCADGVVELTVASVLRELRNNKRVRLLWFDSRSDIGAFSFELYTMNDFDAIFKLFATAPLADTDRTVAKLSAMVSDAEDAKFIFVIPAIDDETVAALGSMSSTSDSSSAEENEVVVYTAEERYAHPAEREAYLDLCRSQLAECGLTLIKGSLDGFSEVPKEEKKKTGGAGHA